MTKYKSNCYNCANITKYININNNLSFELTRAASSTILILFHNLKFDSLACAALLGKADINIKLIQNLSYIKYIYKLFQG